MRVPLSEKCKPRLIVIGPLPPPVHGVTVSTGLVLANPLLQRCFDVAHVDTSDHRDGANLGRWDLTNIRIGLASLTALSRRTAHGMGVVYLPLSQSTAAVLRDSLFVLVASSRGWRVAIHLRGSEFDRFYRDSNPVFRRYLRSVLSRVHGAAVMGESLRGVFDGLVPRSRVAVVPNGTPAHVPGPTSRDPHHVVFLSNLRRRKGVIEAVQAALITLERCPDAHFTFAGAWEDGSLESYVRNLAGRANGAISFAPPVNESAKTALLDSAGVLLFPPKKPEGHPRVVLEALAASVPVVCTNRGAIAETVQDGRSGFVVQDPDPVVLADRLVRLLEDATLRRVMGDNARERYLTAFTQQQADVALADWLSRIVAP